MRLGIASLLAVLALVAAPAAAQAQIEGHIEGYASYDPSTTCHVKPRAGTVTLYHWVVHRYGGGYAGASRPCHRKPASEHQTGRAFDWALDATKRADRQRARAFLDRVLATDARGHRDAWARRMGVMYVIWDDHMYPAWTHFERERYLSSSCPSRKKCSATLRHRDHLHVSLSRRGAKGLTSWYDGR